MTATRNHVRLLHTSDVHLAPRRRTTADVAGSGDRGPDDEHRTAAHLEECLCALASLRSLADRHDVRGVEEIDDGVHPVDCIVGMKADGGMHTGIRRCGRDGGQRYTF